MARDYYSILGAARDASSEDIKKAYRKLAMQYHPDRNPGREDWANGRFKEINEAFSVLGDPGKRRRYDQFGTAEGIDIGDVFSSPFTRGTFEDVIKDFGGAGLKFDFLDGIFGDLLRGRGFSFRAFGGPGGARFGGRAGGGMNLDDLFAKPRQAPPVRYELTISAEEARTGTRKILSRHERRLEVRIPVAVRSGTVVKLANALQLTDGRSGDILIRVKVKERSAARRGQ